VDDSRVREEALPMSPANRFRALPAARAILLLAPILAALAVPAPAPAAEGLTPWDVARLHAVRSAAVSPDGTHVAYTVAVPRDPFEDEDGPAWRELHVLSVADGTSRPFVTGEVSVDAVSWTPEGAGIAFLAKRGDDESEALYVIALAGGEARRVLGHGDGIEEYDFSPDGRRVAVLAAEEEPEEEKELKEKGFDARVYEERLDPVKVWVASIGADGKAGEPRDLGLDGSASELHWSPAGDRLAVAVAPTPLIDDRYMNRRVRIVDPVTGEVVGGIDNPGKLGELAWSPDGARLALIAGVDRHDPSPGRLMVVPAGGATPAEMLTDLLPVYRGEVQEAAWLDSETLVFVGHEGVEASLHRIRRDGGGHAVLVDTGGPIWRSLSLSEGGGEAALVADAPSHPAELFTWSAAAAAGAGGESPDPRPGALGDLAGIELSAAAPERRTDSNAWLAGKRLAPQEVIRWHARDGLELEGVLIGPLDEQPGRGYPLILAVHGGPEAHDSDGWLTGYSDPGQVAAARGFAVFYPNYRGSTGYGVEFSKVSQGDPAGKEFDDLVDAVDYLVASGLADRERVGITGGSYGGYATAWASTYYSERFAAGVMLVGISEKIAKFGTSDIPEELYLVHDRMRPWEEWQTMLERSPVYHVEKARTPLLIAHGDADPRVHPSQSMILYRFLKLLGNVPARLVFYPGEGHGNARAASRLDFNLRMMRWFEHYLQGPGGEPPPPDVDPRDPEASAEGDQPEAAAEGMPPAPGIEPEVPPEIEEEVIEELEEGSPVEPEPGLAAPAGSA
jgi:dipeptidyl aminopeptidase/acylaminoacyl peptidase